MARPVEGKKKDCDIRVRLDSDLNGDLISYCIQNGTDRAKVIRQAIQNFLYKKQDS
jgi:hypothetical protein